MPIQVRYINFIFEKEFIFVAKYKHNGKFPLVPTSLLSDPCLDQFRFWYEEFGLENETQKGERIFFGKKFFF